MIVGTAGHIDHGKTALLRALTGIEGDRRPAERARGITIDLGYLYADLGDGALTGFIDVPGHERFIHNMLAGASGIDLVLLVVAADDGVMPQTREHLAIVELLGIPRARVALTKVDRVDAARVAEVREQIGSLLAGGPFAGAPIHPVSSITGSGIDMLRLTLAADAAVAGERRAEGHFRLAVDRVFTVDGAGLVAAGTAFAGQVRIGDELLLSPSGLRLRVRDLRAQSLNVEHAGAGQRVALNVAGDKQALERIQRGDWLLAPVLHAPTTRIDIQLRVLASETRALAHWTPVHVHLGAQDVTARVALLDSERLAPGDYGLAQLLLNAPAHAVHGDRLVLRDQSAQRTIGGGRVLDPFAPARGRRSPERLAQLEALRSTNLEAALPVLLERADNGLDPAVLERQFNRAAGTWQLPVAVCTANTRQGPRLFATARWTALQIDVLEGLARFHAEQPDELGPDRDRLRRYAFSHLERPVFIALLDNLLGDGRLQSSSPWLHLPEHQVQLSEADEALRQRLWPLLEAGGFDPPWVRELAGALEHSDAEVRLLLRKLARLGLLHQVVKDLFYPEATIRQLAAVLAKMQDETDSIAAALFRDRIGAGRKRSVQILEYFDRIGFTRRHGNERKIRADSALAMSSGSG
ncbi:selenocysteine-specific translation elongation factor [Pseudomonas sp. LS44]|uniref:selenocysteine-specific translation elongation factor n=1 Tax=Pseudomonas sp. LS44 TaxID=1357074 RepID=UPI00215B4D0A|nr:selenocysteine-specific translation elongation factor [Pseudomonas sp. LS44]UVE17206.1 selenocysteine-specific translation elongation factor [Pseudomonas sp. LS44]